MRALIVVLLGVVATPAFADGVERRERPRSQREIRAAEPRPAPVADEARMLFREGVAHAEAGRFAQAATSFRRALALRDAPAIRYNLAAALMELHRDLAAHHWAATVAEDTSAPSTLREEARRLMASVGARLVLLRVRLPEGADALRVDDEAHDAPSLALAPGRHVLEAMAGEELVARQVVELPAGSRATLALEGVVDLDPPNRRLRIGAGVGGAVAAMLLAGIIAAAAR